MRCITTGIRRLVAPCIVVLAACDGSPAPEGSGVPAAGGRVLVAPAACLPEEAALVVGGSPTQTTVATLTDGRWHDQLNLPGSKQALAYLSPSDQLAVFWTDQTYGIDGAHFTRSSNGTAFDTSDFTAWRPDETSRVLQVDRVWLVDRDAWGAGLAQLDLDNTTWRSLDSTLLDATSVAIDHADPAFMFVGPGEHGALCEHTRSISGNAWFLERCHPEIPVAGGGESSVTGPQAIAFPNGDTAIIYLPAGRSATIGATIVPDGDHDRDWLAPETTTSPAIGISFAAAATASGDVIVGVVSVLGEVSMLRYSRDHGWSSPVFLDTIASPAQQIAVGSGICGDDALIAYAAGGHDGDLRVARVRGLAVQTATVAHVAGDAPRRISIVTRQTSPTPAPEP